MNEHPKTETLRDKIAEDIYTHVHSMGEVNGIEDAADAILATIKADDDAKDARIAELEGKLATCVRNAEKYANDCLELEAKLAKAKGRT